jgi:hypothetical protein
LILPKKNKTEKSGFVYKLIKASCNFEENFGKLAIFHF